MKPLGAKFVNLATLAILVLMAANLARQATGWSAAGLALIFPALMLAFILIGGPILIHRTHWTALEPPYEPYDPTQPEAPVELRQHFAERSAELVHLGFEYEGAYRTVRATPSADGFVALFGNPRTRETARLLTAIANNGMIRDVTSLAVFVTEFADGTEVNTSNRKIARAFPVQPPPYHGFALPQVDDLDRLLGAHRALVRRYEAGRTRVDPIGDDPDDYIRQKDYIRPLAHHVACGYEYVDGAAARQRLTWKGAFLLGWKLSPGIKQVREALERRAGVRLLRQLDDEQWVSPQMS